MRRELGWTLVILSTFWAATANAFTMPAQKFAIGLASSSYTKQTVDRSYSGSLPLGVGAEYSIFLGHKLALSGQFETNLEQSEQNVVFMGGGGGVTWYVKGGGNATHDDLNVQSVAVSQLNVFLLGGMASKSFDFVITEKPQRDAERGKVVTLDRRDVTKGSAFGLLVGAGFDYPLSPLTAPGLRVQYFKSFAGGTTPAITAIELWLTAGLSI